MRAAPARGPGSDSPLRDPTYRRLFAAQVLSLVGTGLTTVALSLLAYDLAGQNAGVVVGVALASKMVAYVGIAPLTAAYTQRLGRRQLLIGLDLARLVIVLALPLVTAPWQVYVLIFVLSACAAAFTPAFQALIPEILEDEARYTQALSLSRVAYELENLASPAIAAILLGFVSYDALFVGDGVTFALSALLVASAALPHARAGSPAGRTWARITRGTRRYLAVAELRGLLALNLAVASGSAVVVVNTVVYVRDELGRGASDVALALGVAGGGSLATALVLPALLRRAPERRVLLAGGALLPLGLLTVAVVPGWTALLTAWFVLGVGLAVVQTPAGRLVQRAVREDDGPELFAAQFALSHACWLLTYPVAGVVGSLAGLDIAAALLSALSAVAVLTAAWLWRARR